MLLKLKSYYILKEVDHLLLKKTKDVKKQLPGHVYAINLNKRWTFCGNLINKLQTTKALVRSLTVVPSLILLNLIK